MFKTIPMPTQPRIAPTVYSTFALLQVRDLPCCKDKPADLPDFIDREKQTSEITSNKIVRKQRRQGSQDMESVEISQQGADKDIGEEFRGRGRPGHPGARRENNGWQPTNHIEHEEQFISRIPQAKGSVVRSVGLQHDSQGKILPGKGAQRRGPDTSDNHISRSSVRNMDHQPALAHVVAKQNQGMTGSFAHSQIPKGLDAFSMGDIRQAEKLIESGRIGLDEYARRIASGELNREYVGDKQGTGSFFADEDDVMVASRPWLGSSVSANRAPQTTAAQGRIVPGLAAQRPVVTPPPPPTLQAPRTLSDIEGTRGTSPAAQNTGRESNASGLALLQMLVDRKSSSPGAGKSSTQSGITPRQLTQQQINELIAMSKRSGPKAPAVQPVNPGKAAVKPSPQGGVSDFRPQIVPGSQSRAMEKVSVPSAAPKPAPPHVALLLEQLHRQQIAQQNSASQEQSASAQPAECQQQ